LQELAKTYAALNEVNGGGKSLKSDWKDGDVKVDASTPMKTVKEIGEVFLGENVFIFEFGSLVS
jgi:hypothetical protein